MLGGDFFWRLISGSRPQVKYRAAQPHPIDRLVGPPSDTVPGYMGPETGIPVCETLSVLRFTSVNETLRKIRNSSGSDARFERDFWPIIFKYAQTVHLLPASQYHHHAGIGGLVHHGLEVGLFSLNSAMKMNFSPFDSGAHKKVHQDNMELLCFVTGMCHDIAKPLTDVIVSDESGKIIWSPYKNPLYEWATQHGLERYFIRYVPGRGTAHLDHNYALLNHILGEKNEVLHIAGPDNWAMVQETLSPKRDDMGGSVVKGTNVFNEIVKKADGTSTHRDMRKQAERALFKTKGLHFQVLHTMRALIAKGDKGWRANGEDAMIFIVSNPTTGHPMVLVDWSSAWSSIRAFFLQSKIEGLPINAEDVKALLIQQQVVLETSANSGSYEFAFLPEFLADRRKNVPFIGIGFEDVNAFYMVGDVPSRIRCEISDAKTYHEQQATAAASEQIDRAAAPKGQDAGARPAPKAQDKSAPVKDERSAGAATPSSKTGVDLPDIVSKADIEASKAFLGQKLRDVSIPMAALGDDLLANRLEKRHRVAIWRGALTIEFPHALEGYGIDTKQFLREVGESGWCEKDPESGMRAKRTDTDFDNAIVFTNEVSQHILNTWPPQVRAFLAGRVPKGAPESPANQPVPNSREVTPLAREPDRVSAPPIEAILQRPEHDPDDGIPYGLESHEIPLGLDKADPQFQVPAVDEIASGGELEINVEALRAMVEQFRKDRPDAVVNVQGVEMFKESAFSREFRSRFNYSAKDAIVAYGKIASKVIHNDTAYLVLNKSST